MKPSVDRAVAGDGVMSEAKTNMAFGPYRRGQRLEVDLGDPKVQGLVRGGYLTVVRKESGYDGTVDSPPDSVWADCLFGAGMDSGAVQEEEEVDGTGERRSGEGAVDSA